LRVHLEFPGLHPISFQKYSSDHQDSGPEKMFSRAKSRQVISRTFRVLRGCERTVGLSGLKRPGLPTPTPHGSRVRLDHFGSLSPTACCCSCPRALGSNRGITQDKMLSYTIGSHTTCSNYYNKTVHGMFNLRARGLLGKPNKGKGQDHLKKTSPDPLGKGNGSTHPRQKKAQAKSANHQTKARTTTKSSPCTHASSP
jgi:hypothetical protein